MVQKYHNKEELTKKLRKSEAYQKNSIEIAKATKNRLTNYLKNKLIGQKLRLLYFLRVINTRIKGYEYFKFKSKRYKYFHHFYNTTWKNERAVEIPIVMDYINKYSNRRILEIGNVISHYYSKKWKVIDKYEKKEGIINRDIIDFKPKKKYDLIVSISTMEHIGFDDEIIDKNKVILALRNIKKNCIRQGGLMIITFPLGYNKFMDSNFFKGKLGFDKEYFFKRISKDNKWVEVHKEDIINIKYGKPFSAGNGLVICEYRKP